jgi:hypothetical protein
MAIEERTQHVDIVRNGRPRVAEAANLPAAAADGDWRYERKYFLEFISADEVELLIHMNPRHFRQIHPDRYINNIYLDTPTLRCYWENVDGVSPRFKYRIRWYGDLHQGGAEAILEIKRKLNVVGDKIRIPLGDFNTAGAISEDGVRALFESAGRNEPFLSPGHGLKCILVNRYLRRYYASFDGLFRATVDRGLRFHSFQIGRSMSNVFVNETAAIVEIKYAKDHDALARQVLEAFPFRPMRISKYVHGVNLLRSCHRL